MAIESFSRTFGLGTVDVACSFQSNDASAGSVFRDGKSSIITSVAHTATGRYTITFARGLGRLVAGVAGVNQESPGDQVAANYVYTDAIPSTLEIRTYDISGAALADLATGARVSFIGTFSPRGDLRDAA